jgi:catechol 2,3-dioxygenase-like lactoylglutathione lyase family enzyme
MIQGCHTLLYTSKAEELRAFFRDKLGFPYNDVGHGWLIFDLPEADLGCHPAMARDGAASGTHQISFYCRDLKETVAALRARGVEFTDEIRDVGYGLAIHFRVPGDFELELYQPRYVTSRRAG